MARPAQDGGWQYTDVPQHGREHKTPREAAIALQRALFNEVQAYVGSCRTIGILLSGGMDSRIAAGIIRQLQLESVFSGTVVGITWGVAGSRDVEYAARIASRFGWEWVHCPLTAETLRDNIYIAGGMGAEFAPTHLHAIPQIAEMDGLDAVLAASYGDSVGRAEYSGVHTLQLKPIVPRNLDRFGLVKHAVKREARSDVHADAYSYRDRIVRERDCEYWEVEQQMHYMRRKLNAAMNLIAGSTPFFQLFNSPEVVGLMWSIDPRFRTNETYKELLRLLPASLHDIPWARSGRLFGERSSAKDELPSQHHRYGIWLRRDLRQIITKLVDNPAVRDLGIYNQDSLDRLLRIWPRATTLTTNAIDEVISWMASLSIFVKKYEIQPVTEPFPSDVRDIYSSFHGPCLALTYHLVREQIRE